MNEEKEYSETTEQNTKSSSRNVKTGLQVGIRTALCIGILAIGVIGMFLLASMKKPPAETQYEEPAVKVEAVQVQPESLQVEIIGYGEVKPVDVVRLSPEVPGKVVELHPKLDVGEIVGEGEVLFRIDKRDYQAAVDENKANVQQLRSTIERIKKQYAIDRDRLKTLRRTRDLAQAEFKRLKQLYEEDNVGTRSAVENAEQAYNVAVDALARLEQAVELYPIQIEEARSNLASAQARLERAQAQLDRTVVRAPFVARVKEVSIEEGQYISPGAPVLTLADDSMLEIYVPLDSRDARKWLRFEESNSAPGDVSWFSGLKPVECAIRWTEDPLEKWTGRLHRVVEFDQQTRTLKLAVRVDAKEAKLPANGGLPLVEGMFCSVRIPGKALSRVYALPQWAVSFEDTVYRIVDSRLVTTPVEVARTQNERAYVSAGLEAGDIVVVTRLADPLENILLDPTIIEFEETRS